MSRYRVPSRAAGDRVFVGWDRPLASFFGQVYRDGLPEDENPVFWVGAERFAHVPTVAALQAALAPYAALSPATVELLARDREAGR